MSKLILTIDLDYCFPKFLDVFNDGIYDDGIVMKDFLKSINKENLATPNKDRARLVNKLINKIKNKRVIFEHHEILKYIDKMDIVTNLDYHEDIDYEINELYCGNWANNLEYYTHFDKYIPEILGVEFDELIICVSFQWTPSWDWIESNYVKEKINEGYNKIKDHQLVIGKVKGEI